MNDKIRPEHLKLQAIVFVRQSSPTQVRNHPESARRQRALQQRAEALGWPAERIRILDEDQGKSAGSLHGREAFDEMARGVIQGRVGIIFAVDVARWARDTVASTTLVRECVFANVLLADEQTIYDPNDPHDHVLLGIQGALAEYELRILRRRMLGCWWSKARRGEIFTAVPTGYIDVPGQGLQKHPDLRVQRSLDRLFLKFREMPSVMKLCQWYLDHEEPLPYVAHGDDPHHVQWLPANYKRLLWMLKNPAYAGAYVLGRTKTLVERDERGERVRRRCSMPSEKWEVLVKDCFAAYIGWEQYEENVTKIRKAATMHGAASRAASQRGSALLGGLLRCRRCGHTFTVHYERSGQSRYVCRGGREGRERGKPCLSFSGRHFEPCVSEAILEAVRPASVEATLRAAQLSRQNVEQQRQRLLDELQQRQYEADRARRQYERVEPENRLVAAELERRWNEALAQATTVQTRLECFDRDQKAFADQTDLQGLEDLGSRLDRVWDAPSSDITIKKEILRLLVEEVVVDVDKTGGKIDAWIHFKGGHHVPLSVPYRPHRGRPRTLDAKAAIAALRAVCDDRTLATVLNRHGLPCGKGRWTAKAVRAFRESHGIAPFDAADKQRRGLLCQEDAAAALGISPMSAHRLVTRGVLPAEQLAAGMPCIIRKTDLTLPKVQAAVHRIVSNLPRPLPADPKQLKLF